MFPELGQGEQRQPFPLHFLRLGKDLPKTSLNSEYRKPLQPFKAHDFFSSRNDERGADLLHRTSGGVCPHDQLAHHEATARR